MQNCQRLSPEGIKLWAMYLINGLKQLLNTSINKNEDPAVLSYDARKGKLNYCVTQGTLWNSQNLMAPESKEL